MSYVVGIDVGGTFTDCVLRSVADGWTVADKSYTTPGNVAIGMLGAVRNAASAMALSTEQVLSDTQWLALGTTSLTNRLVSRNGAKVGLLITKGHEEVPIIGRVLAKTQGLSELEKLDILTWRKPEPIVPRESIRGVNERVDYKGSIVVALNKSEVAIAVADLVARGVDAIAVCFLWSFMNPAHEQWVEEFIRERYPTVFVSASHRVAPILGEYERCNSTILSAYLGPAARTEVDSIRGHFGERGYGLSLLVMQSSGGLIWDEDVPETPLTVLGSGPVGGVTGAARLAERLGLPNVIATDMGGTSFDVGLIVEGQPLFSTGSVFERFPCHVSAAEVISIGAGGGSIAMADAAARTLRVGPQSAGAVPGPACYAQGGTDPTVTDADVVLGRIDARSFFGGRRVLDRERSAAAIEEKIARPLGLSLIEAAKGIVNIVDARMADLIRSMTIERGYDPREFAVFAYGGAAPVHVGSFARDLGVGKVIVSPFSAVFSAFGISCSDLIRFYSRSEPLRSPFDPDRVNQIFSRLRERAEADLSRSKTGTEAAQLSFLVDMRFRFQAQELRVEVLGWPLTRRELDRTVERFAEKYEQRFGRGTALAEAPVEMLTFHAVSTVRGQELSLKEYEGGSEDPGQALAGERMVCFGQEFERTPVFAYDRVLPGNVIRGPAVVEAPNTTLIVHPGDRVDVDRYRNLVMTV